MAASILIRRLTAGPEPDGILDRLDAATGLHGERIEGGRRYGLAETRDFVVAMASITGQLDDISDSWSTHLRIEIDP